MTRTWICVLLPMLLGGRRPCLETARVDGVVTLSIEMIFTRSGDTPAESAIACMNAVRMASSNCSGSTGIVTLPRIDLVYVQSNP